MGCFLACFGSSKDKKRRHRQSNRVPSGAKDQRNGSNPDEKFVCPDEKFTLVEKVVLPDAGVNLLQQAGFPKEEKLDPSTSLVAMFHNSGADEFRAEIHGSMQHGASPKNSNAASPIMLGSRIGERSADKLSPEANKEVSFDSAIKTHRPIAADKLSSEAQKEVSFDSAIKTHEPIAAEVLDKEVMRGGELIEKEKSESLPKPSMSISHSEAGSNISSLGSYPPNHRYKNCRESDDEEIDMDVDYNDSDSEEDEHTDSHCSIESTHKMSPGDGISPEVIARKKNTAATNAYDRSLLNPVENLSQLKALKAIGPHKEKSVLDLHGPPIISFSIEPDFNQTVSLKSKMARCKQQAQPTAVDASLSNWLTSPEPINQTRPQQTVSRGSYSPKNLEDRPILGALTIEELKLMSRTTSPRRSPIKSPDDMAIIGSVGSYWSHEESDKDSGSVSSYKGIPNTTSKYQEDKKVNWHSTPFETRLEKALSERSAQA